MPRLEQLVVADGQRAGPDEAHLSAEHVQQLRELVDREAAEERPDACDARIVLDLEERALGLVLLLELGLQRLRVRAHRAELEHVELPLVEADAAVAVEHRPGRLELDRDRDQEPEGQPDDQDQCAHDQVEPALDDPVRADEDRRTELEERDSLTGDVLAAALDQELGRSRRHAHLHASPMRLLDDLDEPPVVEVGISDDQLVDVAGRENRGERREPTERRQARGVLGGRDRSHEVVVDPGPARTERAPQPCDALARSDEDRAPADACELEQVTRDDVVAPAQQADEDRAENDRRRGEPVGLEAVPRADRERERDHPDQRE